MYSTVDKEEVEKFSRLSHEWWDARGPFAPLHRINGLRVQWIVEQINKHLDVGMWRCGDMEKERKTASSPHPHISTSPHPLTLLDIGCGGGLVCEPLATLGAHVTGIDASQENIDIAKKHAKQSQLEIDYRCQAAEELQGAYDIVLALEIIEHVADVPAFVAATCKLVKPGGLIIYSTLNRTAKSFALGIVAAEYILRWVPRGTHQWEKFIKPSELARELRANGVEIKEMTGMVLNPLTWKWELNARNVDVNYMAAGTKTSGRA